MHGGTMYIWLTLSDTDNSNVHHEENSRLQRPFGCRGLCTYTDMIRGYAPTVASRCASETDHGVPRLWPQFPPSNCATSYGAVRNRAFRHMVPRHMVPSLRTMRHGSESAHRRVAGTVHTLGGLHRTALDFFVQCSACTMNRSSVTKRGSRPGAS